MFGKLGLTYLWRELALGDELRDGAPLGVHAALTQDLGPQQVAHGDVHPARVALQQHVHLRGAP